MLLAFAGCAWSQALDESVAWIHYELLRAREDTPTAISALTLAMRPNQEQVHRTRWQLSGYKGNRRAFIVEAESEYAPMTTPDGAIGKVYTYIFCEEGRPALEFRSAADGWAFLPPFGFREGLIPRPHGEGQPLGPFNVTGNYLGQPLSAQGHGSQGVFEHLEQPEILVLDDDLLVGAPHWFRDDGMGPGADREYRYVDLTAKDYDNMIAAGFNLFCVNDTHYKHVRDRNVFFVKETLGTDEYPQLLYRSNYWGPRMFVDEPAARMNAMECRTVRDAVNLLTARCSAYYQGPEGVCDEIIGLVKRAGFGTGDWRPRGPEIPVWETYQETAFYQLMGGAEGFVHEGRYRLSACNAELGATLGSSAELNVAQMLDANFAFMRGAARVFGRDWGIAIYGQCDYTLAHTAVKQAYDQGARYLWFWTSDHDHHLPFDRQLETARVIQAHRRAHLRQDRRVLNHTASVAVAVPEGYIGLGGDMWWTGRFKPARCNEAGVSYGSVNAEVWWQIYRLAQQGIDFDCVVDNPKVIDQAGYQRIIRVKSNGATDLADPAQSAQLPQVSLRLGTPEPVIIPTNPARVATAELSTTTRIRVDGDLREWTQAAWIVLGETVAYSGGQTWGGPADLSARAAFRFDEGFLYCAAQVVDDTWTTSFDGDDIWKNDCLQLGLDPLCDATPESGYQPDDLELGVSWVDHAPYVHTWRGGGPCGKGETQEARVAITRNHQVTCYELGLPWSSLRPLTPSFPGRCGMNLVINDADEGCRKGACEWTRGLAEGKAPFQWGQLHLQGCDQLQTAVPMAYMPPAPVLVKAGSSAVFELELGANSSQEVMLSCVLQHGFSRTPVESKPLVLKAGLSRYQAALTIDPAMPSNSYQARFELRTAEQLANRMFQRLYVLPAESNQVETP